MKKAVIIFFAVIIVLCVILIISKNTLAQFALTKGVKQAVGLDINLEKIDPSLLNSSVYVKNMTIFNPKGFEDNVMANIPELYIAFDIASFFKGNAHLHKIRLELKEFVVIRNVYGKLNVNSIPGFSKTGFASPAVKMDLLELKIGKVVYKDYTQPQPVVSEYNINIDEKYQNITDVKALAELIVARAVINTAVSNLVNINSDSLKGVLKGVEEKGISAIQDAVNELKSIFKR